MRASVEIFNGVNYLVNLLYIYFTVCFLFYSWKIQPHTTIFIAFDNWRIDQNYVPKMAFNFELTFFWFQEKKSRRKKAAEMREALGDAAPPKPVPHTTESLRPPDVTSVEADDEEVNLTKSDDFENCNFSATKTVKTSTVKKSQFR